MRRAVEVARAACFLISRDSPDENPESMPDENPMIQFSPAVIRPISRPHPVPIRLMTLPPPPSPPPPAYIPQRATRPPALFNGALFARRAFSRGRRRFIRPDSICRKFSVGFSNRRRARARLLIGSRRRLRPPLLFKLRAFFESKSRSNCR